MGQAKQRGTFEQRLAMAEARNKALAENIRKDKDMVAFKARHGTQRLATRLVMAGMLTAPRLVVNKQAGQ